MIEKGRTWRMTLISDRQLHTTFFSTLARIRYLYALSERSNDKITHFFQAHRHFTFFITTLFSLGHSRFRPRLDQLSPINIRSYNTHSRYHHFPTYEFHLHHALSSISPHIDLKVVCLFPAFYLIFVILEGYIHMFI
jgi:hypothetical protein